MSRGISYTPLLSYAFNVVVPSMGESVTEGTIAAILKNQGKTFFEVIS